MALRPIQIEHKLLTVPEYEQMIAAGVLGEDDRLELIEGEFIKMSPIGSVHVYVVNQVTNLFAAQVRELAIVSVQNPIRLTNSEPQPDVADTWQRQFKLRYLPRRPGEESHQALH